jgi:hypothetical protein
MGGRAPNGPGGRLCEIDEASSQVQRVGGLGPRSSVDEADEGRPMNRGETDSSAGKRPTAPRRGNQ